MTEQSKQFRRMSFSERVRRQEQGERKYFNCSLIQIQYTERRRHGNQMTKEENVVTIRDDLLLSPGRG